MDLNIIDKMTALEIVRRSENPDAFLIVELMSMSNEMLIDLPAIQANAGDVHKFLQRKEYPEGQGRLYNEGVEAVATETKPVEESIGMIANYSFVDAEMAANSGNIAECRNTEAQGIILGMGITQARWLIYGDRTSDPKEINGLATRYKKLSDENVFDFDGGASEGEASSVYVVAAGTKLAHLIYPLGSKTAGVERIPSKEVENVKLDSGGHMPAYVEYFKAAFGLAVENPTAVKRIANIPRELDEAGRKKLADLILYAQSKLPPASINTMVYANSDLKYQLEQAGRDKQVVVYPDRDPWGKPVSLINGMRLRKMDVILNTEELVA